MRLGSLFDGIGGFPLAAVRNGITPVWASEIESFPMQVTKERFPSMAHLGDVTKINGTEIEPVDVITFGSPCQDLSIAGIRKGLDGERSGLFGEAIRIIREMRTATNGKYPRFAVWENVPGALSSNKGKDFREVIESLCGLAEKSRKIPMPRSGKWAKAGLVTGGGYSVAWRVLDAQYWGVAQRRCRIYALVDLRGQCAGKILFEREGVRWHPPTGGSAGQGIAGSAESGAIATICLNDQGGESINVDYGVSQTLRAQSHGNHPCVVHPTVAGTLCASGAGMIRPAGMASETDLVVAYSLQGNMIGRELKNGPQGDGVNKEVSFTPNTIDRHAVCYDHKDLGRRSAEFIEQSPTLKARAGTGGGNVPLVHQYKVRRLTPLECERLQGYTDGWTDIDGASDTVRYKALGNSVAIPCVEFVIGGIAEVLRRSV